MKGKVQLETEANSMMVKVWWFFNVHKFFDNSIFQEVEPNSTLTRPTSVGGT